MSASNWHLFTGVEPSRLHEARLQAHYAVQWLARAARAYAAVRPNDEHTNLGWDDGLGGLTTHPLASGGRLGLRLATLTLVLLGKAGEAAHELALDGRIENEVRAWLGHHLSDQGMDPRALDVASPYDMPAHALGCGGRYDAGALAAELSELSSWYANAVHALTVARQRVVARYPDMPPVRCWPHHFDFDTLLSLGASGATVGTGFSPGDEYYDEPYFYVSLYPAPSVASLPRLAAIGHWHAQDFTAAVAPASRILEAKNQHAEIDAFLKAAIDIAIAALDRQVVRKAASG